jgi:preprotein translocase subunit SecE
VARDRQRAKQRKARRAGQNPGPAPSQPRREDVPGELEHASGEADEFDAALVSEARGDAAGEPADDVVDPEGVGDVYEDEIVGLDDAAERDEQLQGIDEDLDEPDAELEEEAVAAAPARARRAAEPEGLRASWAELQRVQWPDRRQVAQATAVVLGFVVVAGLYLGVADRVAQEVVDFII